VLAVPAHPPNINTTTIAINGTTDFPAMADFRKRWGAVGRSNGRTNGEKPGKGMPLEFDAEQLGTRTIIDPHLIVVSFRPS
jgi:hypothetical protein